MALPREKAPDLVTICLWKEKEYGREWQSPTVMEKHPKVKQISASLWALQNYDTGLFPNVELIKTGFQKDKLWPCVRQYPLLRGNKIS